MWCIFGLMGGLVQPPFIIHDFIKLFDPKNKLQLWDELYCMSWMGHIKGEE